jgi:hypothetical protein
MGRYPQGASGNTFAEAASNRGGVHHLESQVDLSELLISLMEEKN